ncbi:MAG: Ig-like domain-containing protein [Candidatus Sericytochromatia bacterium]
MQKKRWWGGAFAALMLSACGQTPPVTAPQAPPEVPEAPASENGGGGGGPLAASPTPTPATPTPTASGSPSPSPTRNRGGGGGGGSDTPSPSASPSATPTPETSANQAPTLGTLTQSPMKIEVDASGLLSVSASDPDGDALTYTWSAEYGTVEGDGARATYRGSGGYNPYERIDDTVTVVVSDGRGGTVTETFTVDLYVGGRLEVEAADAWEWDPTRVASTFMQGDVTVEATGDFSRYSGVLCEYTTTEGRQLALLEPGQTRLTGVAGYCYFYLIRTALPDDPMFAIPAPDIRLRLSAGGTTETVAVTQDQVFDLGDKGVRLFAPMGHGGNPTPRFVMGENAAQNGARPYGQLLNVITTQWGASGDTGIRFEYRVVAPGDDLYGGSGNGFDESRVTFTDSVGGSGDNTGACTVYDISYD